MRARPISVRVALFSMTLLPVGFKMGARPSTVRTGTATAASEPTPGLRPAAAAAAVAASELRVAPRYATMMPNTETTRPTDTTGGGAVQVETC